MAAPKGSQPAGSITYKGKDIPLYQKPLNDGTGRIGIYDGNGTRYRTIAGPSGAQDLVNQVAPGTVLDVPKEIKGQVKQTAGKAAAAPILGGITAGGEASLVSGTVSAGTAATATGVPVATTLGSTLTAALAGPLIIAGILKWTGKRPFESNLAAPLFGAERGYDPYGTPPGNPGYKGAKYKGAQLVGETVAQDKLEGWPGRETNPLHIPQKILESNNYFEIEAWKDKVRKLNSLLREEVGRGVPTGTLYPNYTSVTRYSDEAHGSRPTTYAYHGPEGEFEAARLPSGLGITNLGRVTHGPENKRGIPVDLSGDRFRASRTALYATRALVASGGKMDPELAFQIGQEKAARAYKEMIENLKPVSVAWGRHDNPIDPKTAQLLKRTAEPKQAVWNQAENGWQDANLGLKVDQKAAWKRWEATRPAGHKNDKPQQGSVVDFVSNQNRASTASISNRVEANELHPPSGHGWRPDGESGASRPLYTGDKQTGYQVWKNGEITTKGFGTWNDTAAQQGPGIPPLVGVSDAAAELAARKKAEAAARLAAEKKRKEEEEARQRAAALAAAQSSSGGSGSGSSGSESGVQGSNTATTEDDLKTTKLGGKAPVGISGKVASTKTNHVTGVKTYLMEDGRIISKASDGRPYLAGYDKNQVLLHQQQEQAKASTAALLSRGGSIGDWGAAATMSKEELTSTTPHKPGDVFTPTAKTPQPKYDYPPVDYATDIRDKAEILGNQPTTAPMEVASTYAPNDRPDPAIQTALNAQKELPSAENVPLDPAIQAAMDNRPTAAARKMCCIGLAGSVVLQPTRLPPV